MIKRFRTTSGSIYELNYRTMQWSRESSTEHSGPLRTEGGEFKLASEPTIGEGVHILCPPLSPSSTFRDVYTSDVTEIFDA